jgi:plasmid maintenance system antidote protein VapI
MGSRARSLCGLCRILILVCAARYFGTSERFWLGLQVDFDLEEARTALSDRLEREVKPLASAA